MRQEPHWETSFRDGALHVRLEGIFDWPAWRGVLRGVATVPGYGPNATVIYDAREAGFDFSASDVRELVADVESHQSRRGPDFRVAFVVARDLDFGISRMIQSLCAELPFEAITVRSMDEAEQWAAVPRARRR
jgi:hypothetical protein